MNLSFFLEFNILKSDTYLEQRRDSVIWIKPKEKTITKNVRIIIEEQQ